MTERDDHDFARRIAEPLREPEHVEANFEARIHAAARAAVARGEAPPARRRRRMRRSLGWLVAPRRFSASPLASLAAAAGFAALVAGATLALSRDDGAVTVHPTPPQVVQFAIVAPTAHRVSLVGDFNAWDASSTPMAKGAVEGLWMVTVPLGVGSYQYAFVIDGETWVSDPAAPLALEDEFGAPSSLLTVRSGRT